MKIEERQYEQIKDCFPKHRKPAKISNQDVIEYIAVCRREWVQMEELVQRIWNWHVIYVRVNRWATKGVRQSAFVRLQPLGIIQIQVSVMSLDSTCIKVHPDGMGALKKRAAVHWQNARRMEHQAPYSCRI